MFGFVRNRAATTQSPPHQNNFRSALRLEALEAREVPVVSVRTVTALGDVVDRTNDATALTLREALLDANAPTAVGPQRMVFAANLAGQTILIDQMLPRFDKDIFVDGPTDRVTVQRNTTKGDFRLIEISPITTATLARLKLYDGRATGAGAAGSGGAIYNAGALTVQSCDIVGNVATNNGGGINSAVGSTLDVTLSSINFNQAANGGGISLSSGVTANLTSTAVQLNNADYGAGINISAAAMVTATVTLSGVDVRGNVATKNGGGIYVSPVAQATPVLTLTGDTTIRDNFALDPLLGKGGGIYLGAGTINLNGVAIGDNHAQSGDGMYRSQGTTKNVNQTTDPFVAGDTEAVG